MRWLIWLLVAVLMLGSLPLEAAKAKAGAGLRKRHRGHHRVAKAGAKPKKVSKPKPATKVSDVVTITGQLVSKGKPVVGVEITFYGRRHEYSVTTDKKGQFLLKMYKGQYRPFMMRSNEGGFGQVIKIECDKQAVMLDSSKWRLPHWPENEGPQEPL